MAEIRERAMADINAHVERVKADLRTEVARLTIELAEKVVERNLDRDTNMALIESFIEQAGRRPDEPDRAHEPDRIEGYAGGALRGGPGRGLGRPGERRAVPVRPRPRAVGRAARRARRPVAARRAAAGDRRGPARGQGVTPHRPAMVSFARRRRAGPASCPRSSTALLSSGWPPSASTRWPRCAPPSPSTTTSAKRLAEALGTMLGKPVELRVIVDPSVMGGLVARVGDVVIDGTVRHRLELLKEAM